MSARARCLAARIAILAPLILLLATRIRVGAARVPSGRAGSAVFGGMADSPLAQSVMDRSEAVLRLVCPDQGNGRLHAWASATSRHGGPALAAWVVECDSDGGAYRCSICWRAEGAGLELIYVSRTRRSSTGLSAMPEPDVRAWSERWLARLGCVPEDEPVSLRRYGAGYPVRYDWSSPTGDGNVLVDERTGELVYFMRRPRSVRPFISPLERVIPK